MNKTCCVTGNRPKGFSWDYYKQRSSEYKDYIQNMTSLVVNLIENENYTHFIAGGAMGVDTDFAETIIKLRDSKYKEITLELAIPFINHHSAFPLQDKKRFEIVKNKANTITYTMERYTNFAYHVRNRYMVDNSSTVLAFWNGETKGGTYSTINCTKKQGKQLLVTRL